MVAIADTAMPGLERSCGPRDWIRIAPPCPGLERAEACFAQHAFAPHRHDTYAIGVTVHGLQAFHYRGAARRSGPGQAFVLHPDELHDGGPGTAAGLRYRILYVDPGLIADALGGRALPFVREVVSDDRRILAAILPALDLDLPLEDLQRDQILVDLAHALAAAERSPSRSAGPPDRQAVLRARAYLDAHTEETVRSEALEAVCGLDRYALARQFRQCLGTSPYRYLLLRRLDRARALVAAGTSLVEAALAVGFADQSHLSRHFKRAYGLAPGRWAALRREAGATAGSVADHTPRAAETLGGFRCEPDAQACS
jgi:AraC-like DNA-binding protein